jgi:serine/threonine-protein kinase
MNRERWRQIDRIFDRAMESPPEERAAFLDRECAGDGKLRAEVESLLAHYAQEDDFMEQPATADAARLMLKREAEMFVGRTVGNYRITKRVGTGGMGEVYLAQDSRLARPVALKLLAAHLTADEDRVRRFRLEALAASALNHPNIITVYEIGQCQGRDFIATEYVEGVTLRVRMRGRPLSIAASLDIALQIASALAAAHGAGIVHRDIKPENVMMRPDGLVKVLDFGVAKQAEPVSGRDPKQQWIKTTTGVVIGTTSYMSPEQARGEEVDKRSDIWSLGVILYEMVGRRLPFPGHTPTDRMAAILERQPEPLSKLRRGIPAELERILNQALAKERGERYATAADLTKDLRRLRATLGDERPMLFALPTLARRPLSYRRRAVVAMATLSLLITVLVGALFYLRPSGSAAINSLAVLPFVNIGDNADAEYLSDGITEDLINNLSQLPELKVMSRSSVFRYKGREVDARAVGDALRVQAVLTGTIAQQSDDLSVSVEMADARDNSHLWGGKYKRKLTDIVVLQGEITRDVSRKLRERLSGADEQKLVKNYTENPEAYQLYLKGRYHVLKLTRSEVQTGVSYFQKAIGVDPSYTLAYVGLADAYRVLALAGEMPSTEELPKAKAAAEKAVALDENLAEAHAVLGFIIFWYDWDWKAAEDQFIRALELDPNSAETHEAYAHLLSYTGRHAEGLAEIKRARELDPLNMRTNALEGAMLINAGQADNALVRLREALELESDSWFVQEYAASAHIEKGMFAEAVTEARKARDLSEYSTRPTAFLAYSLAKSGRRAEARAELEGLLKLSTQRYVSPYNIAMIYNGLGARDKMLAWLERGYQQRDPRMVFLKVEPKWNNSRDDPRFQDLLRRIGLLQ